MKKPEMPVVKVIKTHCKVSNHTPDLPRDVAWIVERIPVRHLKPARGNARTHSKKQVQEIANSMARFGNINPVIADSHGNIIAGHARFSAVKLLGLAHVPVIRLHHLTETEIRAYRLADNKLAQKSGWDREILSAELEELEAVLPEIGLDLSITGFEPAEVDAIKEDLAADQTQSDDECPELEDRAVARKGDLFILGNHRLIAGDARDEATYRRLMQSQSATMAFLDPPYNVRIKGHVGGRGRIQHQEFLQASGEMSSEQFINFLGDTLGLCARHTADGGISYITIDWRHSGELLKAGAAVYDELKNICVWVKTTPGQGSFYRSQHEFVFVYKKGKAAHLNTFELGQHGRTRTNVWNYPGANSFRAGRMDDLRMHPTVKPLAMVVDAMKDCSQRGSIILDAFAGSGTTIVAAEQVGRRAFCIEIDPRHVEVAVRRWQKVTGKDAILESSGQTFDELEALRSAKAPTLRRRGGQHG